MRHTAGLRNTEPADTPVAGARFLAISGSLRAVSSNRAVLEAVRRIAAPDVEIDIYEGVDTLPHFNPDDDVDVPPPVVQRLRERVGAADGLIISSPEYAHGIPGSLKNALDWLVASLEFPGKPVALISTSPTSVYVNAQLTEVLTTMSARLVPEACVTVSVRGRGADAETIVADPELVTPLRRALDAMVVAARR